MTATKYGTSATYTSCGKCGRLYPAGGSHSCPGTAAPPWVLPSISAAPPWPNVIPTFVLTTATAPTGWRCPGCSRCFAPHVDACPSCGNGAGGAVASGVAPLTVGAGVAPLTVGTGDDA